MHSKLKGLLPMCRKAGQLAMGFDPVKESVRKRQAQLILFAADVSPRTAEHMRYLAEQENVKCVTIDLTMDEMWSLCGKRIGVAAVTNGGFAKAIERLSEASEKPEKLGEHD